MTTPVTAMHQFEAERGFLDLGNYRIAIAAIEAVQFTTNSETNTLRIQVLLKSGKEIQTILACVPKINPLTKAPARDTVYAIEHAIRAAIVVDSQN